MLLLLAFAVAPFIPEPMPHGVVARLGSPRYVCSHHSENLSLSPDGEQVMLTGEYRGAILHRRTGVTLVPNFKVGFTAAYAPDGSHLTYLPHEEYNLYAYRRPADWWPSRRFTWKDRITSNVAALPGGRYVAAGGGASVGVWEYATGKRLWHITGPGTNAARVALHPKETEVAVIDSVGTLRVWDLTTGKLRWSANAHKPEEHPWHYGLAYHRGGDWLASGGRDGVLHLWSPAGKPSGLRRGGPAVRALDAGAGGTLAAGMSDGTIALYDAAAGKELRRWRASALPVAAVRFAPDGHELVACVEGSTRFTRWDARTGRPIDPAAGHDGQLLGLAYRPDGRLVSLGTDRQLIEWREGRSIARTLPWEGEDRIGKWETRARMSVDGSVVAVHDTSRLPISLFDTATGKLLCRVVTTGYGPECALAGSSRRLFVRDSDGFSAWDVATRRSLWSVKVPGPKVFAASPDGHKVLTTPEDRDDAEVQLRDGGTGVVLRTTRPELESRRFLFSPDGRAIAFLGNGELHLWDTVADRISLVAGLGTLPDPKAFAPDSRLLAISTVDGMGLIEVATGRRVTLVRHPILTHGKQPNETQHMAFSPDGRTLAIASLDGTILLWDAGHDSAPGDQARLWEDLASEDAAVAWRAVWSLARTAGAEAFLARKLRPTLPLPRALLERLDAEDFAVREAAGRDLSRYGFGDIQISLAGEKRLEVRKRLQRALDGQPRPLRESRALATLERAGATALLKRLAAGAAGSDQTEEARAALRRARR